MLKLSKAEKACIRDWRKNLPDHPVWIVDAVSLANRGVWLTYTPDRSDGPFIELMPDGTINIGYYEGAFDHIGNAIFVIELKIKWPFKDAKDLYDKLTGEKLR